MSTTTSDTLREAFDSARKHPGDGVERAGTAAVTALGAVAGAAAPAVEKGYGISRDAAVTAGQALAPHLATARERAAAAAEQANTALAPRVSAARDVATERVLLAREVAAERGGAALSALRESDRVSDLSARAGSALGAVQSRATGKAPVAKKKPKRGKWFLLLGALAGAAAAAAYAARSRGGAAPAPAAAAPPAATVSAPSAAPGTAAGSAAFTGPAAAGGGTGTVGGGLVDPETIGADAASPVDDAVIVLPPATEASSDGELHQPRD